MHSLHIWPSTVAFRRRISGAHSRLLRYALRIHWTLHVRNATIYEDYPDPIARLRQQRLQVAAHILRLDAHNWQPAAAVVTWTLQGKFRPGGQNVITILKQLMQDVQCETVQELESILRDKEALSFRL